MKESGLFFQSILLKDLHRLSTGSADFGKGDFLGHIPHHSLIYVLEQFFCELKVPLCCNKKAVSQGKADAEVFDFFQSDGVIKSFNEHHESGALIGAFSNGVVISNEFDLIPVLSLAEQFFQTSVD